MSGPRFGAGCAVEGERQVAYWEPIQVIARVVEDEQGSNAYRSRRLNSAPTLCFVASEELL